jgi:UDP-4-amino-4,6-dideoxy-N-acetyl-beta-L-altrosamine transaminase
MIPYGRQDISQADIDAITQVLKSDFLTQGPQVPAFENSVCRATQAAHAVAASSATASLHIACLALGLGPNDLLWTSPITFVASANVGLYCGAQVDFVDINPQTFNMCPDALAEKLDKAARAGRLPKIIIPVHMAGQSCDMATIGTLARQYGVHVIEDASHAIGGRYKGAPIGNCAHSDICVFSFHPVKIVTTAEGGVATTNDPDLAAKMQRLRSHGITRDPALMTHAPDGPWYYQQIELGYNYRMTELQAALGVSQMMRLDQIVSDRHKRAQVYDQALHGMALRCPHQESWSYSAYHLYIIQLQDPARHRAVFDGLRADGIGVNLHYIPVPLQPYYRQMGFNPEDFPNALDYYARAISIPLFPTLSSSDQNQVIAALLRHTDM